MNDDDIIARLKWGLRWGAHFAVAALVLGIASYFVFSGTEDQAPPTLYALLILGFAAACLIAGAGVGLLKPLATRDLLGSILAGVIIGSVLAPIAAGAALVVASVSWATVVDIAGGCVLFGAWFGFLGGWWIRQVLPEKESE